MTTFRRCVQISDKWVVILIALTTGITAVAQTINITPASAISDNYPWPNAPCASSGSNLGQTSGTGYWCSNYNWGQSTCPSGDTYCTAGNKMNGYYQYDQWGEGFRNCVSYTSWMLSQTFNVNPSNWGNGTDWNNSALAAHYTDDSSPQIGDIAQWNGTKLNQWGHVAYVYNVVNGVAYYAEYNYAGDGNFLNTYTSTTQGSPSNYIHIGTVSGGSPSTPRPAPLQYNTEMDVFKRGSDGAIWQDTIQSGSSTWGGWTSRGGNWPNDPVAVQFGNEMDVFATGMNNHVYQITYQPGTNTWGSWTDRGGTNLTGRPAAIAYSGSELDIFSRGTDGSLYRNYWNGSTWSGFNPLSGNGSTQMASDPTVTKYGSEMDVYIRGTDSNLWKSGGYGGSSIGSLGSMGSGSLASNPVAITYNSEMDVYSNNTSGTLIKDVWNGSSWSGWNSLTGQSFTGSPTAVQYGSEMDVYDRGIADSYIYQDTWTTGWGGWTSRGGNEQGDPTAIQFGTEMDVFATNYSNNTDKDTWLPGNGGSWSGFGSLL